LIQETEFANFIYLLFIYIYIAIHKIIKNNHN
jgi:hypothetical protein